MSWLPQKELRPVGLPWLGYVPASWSLRKFRYCFRESAEKNGDTPVGEMLSVSGYRGVEVKQYEDENRRRTVDELADYRVVRKGQLAVNTMWLNYAGLGVSAFEGHVSPAYRAYWINPGLEHRYINYLMRSSAYVDGYTALLTGIRPNSLQMGRNDLMNFPILCPPIDDQRVIADFLDRETPKIDALIAKQEQLIATLREDRSAVVDQFFNQPDALATRLSRLLRDRPTYGVLVPQYVDEDGIEAVPFIRVGDFSSGSLNRPERWISRSQSMEYRRTILQPGDVLLGVVGKMGSAAVVPEWASGSNVARAVGVLRPKAGVISTLLAAWFSSSQFLVQAAHATAGDTVQPTLGMRDLAGFGIHWPSTETLPDSTYKVDALISKAEQVIEKLREYRSVLITDAVTGKIDVRGAA